MTSGLLPRYVGVRARVHVDSSGVVTVRTVGRGEVVAVAGKGVGTGIGVGMNVEVDTGAGVSTYVDMAVVAGAGVGTVAADVDVGLYIRVTTVYILCVCDETSFDYYHPWGNRSRPHYRYHSPYVPCYCTTRMVPSSLFCFFSCYMLP